MSNYFPVRIILEASGEERVVHSLEELPKGDSFTIVETSLEVESATEGVEVNQGHAGEMCDRLHVIMSNLYEFVLESPIGITYPAFRKLGDHAANTLMDMYQLAGGLDFAWDQVNALTEEEAPAPYEKVLSSDFVKASERQHYHTSAFILLLEDVKSYYINQPAESPARSHLECALKIAMGKEEFEAFNAALKDVDQINAESLALVKSRQPKPKGRWSHRCERASGRDRSFAIYIGECPDCKAKAPKRLFNI